MGRSSGSRATEESRSLPPGVQAGDYEPSERATADAVRIREDMRLACYWHDERLHKKAVDEMVISTLEDYARWLRVQRSGVH